MRFTCKSVTTDERGVLNPQTNQHERRPVQIARYEGAPADGLLAASLELVRPLSTPEVGVPAELDVTLAEPPPTAKPAAKKAPTTP